MRTYTRGEFLSLSAMLAGASLGATLPAVGVASPLGERIGVERFEASRLRRAGRKGTFELAAKKKKKKKKKGSDSNGASNSEVHNLATRNTPVIDAHSTTVLPGFIDCHCHPSGVEELYDVDANLRTVKEIQDALRKKVAQTPAGFWVNAYMFDDTMRTAVVNSLFGDGAAAVAVRADAAGTPEGPAVVKFASRVIPEAVDAMRYDWDAGQNRFSFFLDRDVPYVVGADCHGEDREQPGRRAGCG